MKNFFTLILLCCLGLSSKSLYAQLFIAPGQSIYAASGSLLYSKESLAGDANSSSIGKIVLAGATLQVNPSANYTSPLLIETNNAVISTLGIAANRDFTVGALDMQGNTTINLASNTVHVLRFLPSSVYHWSGTLTITGWQGSFNGTTGTKGRVFFGSNQSGLESTMHLPMIKFYDGTYTYDAVHLSTGEVVPTIKIYTSPSASLPSSMCVGSSHTVNFTYDAIQNFGNSTTFTAQLSDAVGSFTNPTSIGTVIGNASGNQNITVTIPSGLSGGAGFRIRVVSDTPSVTGSDNGSDIYIKTFSPGTISSDGESICSGTSASSITSTTSAEGGNNVISYSWRSSDDEYTTAIIGATSATYTPPSGLTTQTSYRRYASDGLCNTTPTPAVGTWTVGINISLGGTISNSNQNALCAGNSTSLSLSGHSGSIQWQSSTDNSSWSDISGSTTPTLNTGSLLSTTYYRTVVTHGSCAPAYASSVTVTVNTPIYSYNNTGLWGTTSNWNVSCDQGATYSVATSEPTTPSIAYVNDGQTVTATDLTISAQNQLIVKSGGKLTVTGNFVNNGGYFKIESGGSLVQGENSSQTGAGTYVVERTLTGTGGSSPSGRFWYTGVPMSGATSGGFSAQGPNNKLWMYSENSAAYTEIDNNTTGIDQGKGYVFRGGSTGTYSFSSNNIGNGNVTYNLTRTSTSAKPGFNLISNPYPSHLSWDQLYNSTVAGNTSPLLPTIWYRTATSGGTMLFDTYNATMGVGTNNSGTSGNGTQVTGTIAPFQSVWVRVQSGVTSTTMTATNAMRSHGTQNFLTLTPATVRLNISNGDLHDETLVVLNEDLSNEYDYRDSGKEIPSATVHQLYSLEGTNKVAINGIANALAKDTLQLGLQIPTAGTYSINCTEHTFSDLVYLEDKITDAYIELSNTTTYSFTSEAGTFNNRFVLHFAPVPALPGQTAATAIAMPTSNWPQCNNVTSEDQWHAFTATSEGISIAVNTSTTDVLIELQDGAGNVVAQENAVSGIGNETLNFYGLIAGQTYKVGVHNTLSGEPTGTYGICVKSLKRGGCDYGAGPYSLCQYYKATWAGSTGVSYTFTFTGTSGPATGQTFTRTQNSDICVLSTVTPLLPYGSTYSVVISNTYTLTDGAGNTEQITVPSINGCQVNTIAEPQTTLSASNSCNNGPRFRGAVVSSAPWVCGASNWRWRFTEVNPLTMQAVGLPIELNRGAASNYLNLGTVMQLQSGKTYAVQTAPVFAYTASNYQWGPTQYMCIVGNTAMTLEGTDATQGAEQSSTKDAVQDATQDLNAVVYVTEGNHVNIQLSNAANNNAKRADIYDVTGKLVKSVRLVEGMNQVELSEASGIYMVRTTVGNQSETTRVFIQK